MQRHAVLHNNWLVILGLSLFSAATPALAGTYIFASESGPDTITHPTGYSGDGGTIIIGVCISPSSENAEQMQVPLKNVVTRYNQLKHSTGNVRFGSTNDVPTNMFDFESAVMHEVGHCLGLAHVNAASESGLSGPDLNYTRATNGANNVFNINAGPDQVVGSADDLRGDDGNLHWFEKNVNNPFTLPMIVDDTTYTLNLDYLPAPDTFAANGDRNVATLYGFANTESIMQQGMSTDEVHRELIADDVATLKMAMSGLDQLAGTSDDYIFQLEYRGISSSNCDITVAFDNSKTSFAVCSVSGTGVSLSHMSITKADVYYNNGYNWYFNPIDNVANNTPDSFVFNDVEDVSLRSIVVSNSIQISGLNSDANISIVGGQYSVNFGVFVTTDGMVNNGDFIRVRHTSASAGLTSTSTTLTVGDVSDTFTSTTIATDSTPDAFFFNPAFDVAPGVLVTSDNIVVTGFEGSVPIFISDGEYSINNGDFTNEPGSINSGASVRVRHFSSNQPATIVSSIVNIGGVSGTFFSSTAIDETNKSTNARPDDNDDGDAGFGSIGWLGVMFMLIVLLDRVSGRRPNI